MVNNKAIRQAIYEKLNVAGVTTLLGSGSASLVHGLAPPTATYPLLVYNKQSGTPSKAFGNTVFDSHLWLIKGVTKNKDRPASSAAEDISKAVNDLLDFGTLTITGGTLLHLTRESDVDYIETDGDQVYSHRGALYRVVIAD